MTPIDLINTARQLTYDDKPNQQTWSDAQYLIALNDARAFLFGKCPEARVTAVVGLTAYADITETTLSDTMLEDAVYRNFLIEWMAASFFNAGSRDTANRQKALDHQQAAMRALSSLTGGR